jgi:bifunctional non-homologous end joining protein LigD
VDLRGHNGQARFELLQAYHKAGGTLIFYVFDLLYLDGKDLTSLPLMERKQLLKGLVHDLPNVRYSDHIEHNGIAFYEAARQQGLEGIMAKQADSPYRADVRTEYWLKIKIRQQQEAVIGSFTEPRGGRQSLGAVVLGVYEGNDLVYIGHTGVGFNAKSLAEVHAKLKPLVQKECPFRVKPKTNAPVQWVKPKLVCEIAFQNWTEDGIVRQPVFLGLREDKSPRSVVREKPLSVAKTVEAAEKKTGKRVRRK